MASKMRSARFSLDTAIGSTRLPTESPGSGTDALDVVQDSFSLLFRKIGGFRGESLFSTWLFRIVVNASIDHRRKEKSRDRGHATSLATLQSREPEDPTDGPVVRAETRELGAHVQASIGRLSPKLRAIMVLRYLEGMSYEELACTLELSMGTVKSRLARAHVALERVLRGTLAPYGIVEPVDDASGPDCEPSYATIRRDPHETPTDHPLGPHPALVLGP